MAETYLWIAVRPDQEPYVVLHEDSIQHILESDGECVHRVPERIWNHYLNAARAKDTCRYELQTHERATVGIVTKPGIPMTKVVRHDFGCPIEGCTGCA